MSESGIAKTTESRLSAAAFEPGDIREAMGLAKLLVESGMVPKALLKPEAVLYVIMAGREMGLSVVQSLRSLHIIDGKLVMSADLMQAQVLRSELAEYFVLIETSDRVATYETKRRGAPVPTRMSFSIEQAARAGLTNKQNWKNHPEAMLRARCISALARAVYPDALAGMYDPDEAAEMQPVPATISVVGAAQSPALAPASPPNSAAAAEDPAAKWLEKIAKAGSQAKPVSALVSVATQIAKNTENGVRGRLVHAWAAQLERSAGELVATQDALDSVRGLLLDLHADFLREGGRVCDRLADKIAPSSENQEA